MSRKSKIKVIQLKISDSFVSGSWKIYLNFMMWKKKFFLFELKKGFPHKYSQNFYPFFSTQTKDFRSSGFWKGLQRKKADAIFTHVILVNQIKMRKIKRFFKWKNFRQNVKEMTFLRSSIYIIKSNHELLNLSGLKIAIEI